MKIVVNGKIKEVSEDILLSQLLNEKNLDSNKIIVQVNEEVINKSNYEKLVLTDNSTVEILNIVGGG